MQKPRNIRYLVVHCTASSQAQTVQSIIDYHLKTLRWSRPGYHYIIDASGVVHATHPEERISNGVKGHNTHCINIAYIGGVECVGGKLVAKDNRTNEQKKALRILLKTLRERYPKAVIQGHRDFSPDINGNGIIDPWELIKECPSFDAKAEYANL